MQRIPDTDEIPHLRDSIVKLLQDFQVQVHRILYLLKSCRHEVHVILIGKYNAYCIARGENLHEFRDFTATHKSFLHEILGMPHQFNTL